MIDVTFNKILFLQGLKMNQIVLRAEPRHYLEISNHGFYEMNKTTV